MARIVFLLAVALVAALLGSFGSNYTINLLTQGFTFAILAITADILWGTAGILTFGSSAVFGIGAYAIGIVFVHGHFGAWSVPLGIGSAMLATALLSAGLGWLTFYARTRISDFYVTLVTLGIAIIFQQITVYGGQLTGGSNGLSGFRVDLLSAHGWYWVSACALILVMLGAFVLVRSDFGLILSAIKDHDARTRYIGIDTPFVKTIIFIACNMIGALSGCLYALHTNVVAPGLVDVLLATNVLIWVTLGGKGTLFGPVLIAIAINLGSPALNSAYPLYWQGILGLAFVVAVVALPQGLLPALLRLFRRSPGRFRLTISGDRQMATPDMPEPIDRSPTRIISISPSPANDAPVLELENVVKRYGTFTVIKGISFAARPGELISIVGPNGAGKTSLIRCISDGIERSQGHIRIRGTSIGTLPPDRIVGLGLGRKFQGASVFPGLSVGACILLASWKGRLPSVWRRSSKVEMSAAAARVVRDMALDTVWNEPAGDLSHGRRQAVEIAMVLALEPKLLLLDEPTAGLTKDERRQIGDLLQTLVRDYELTVLIIEHDFDFVKEISTRMLVLHDGGLVADGSVAEVAASSVVRNAYLGHRPEEIHV